MKNSTEQPFVEATPRHRSGGGMIVVIILLVAGFFGVVLLGGAALLLARTSKYEMEVAKAVRADLITRGQAMQNDSAASQVMDSARAETRLEVTKEVVSRFVTISLDGNDKLRYDGTVIETADIIERLRTEKQANERVIVKVIVPGETKHSRVVELLDSCKLVVNDVEISVAPANPLLKYRLTIDADSVMKHDDRIIAREDLAAELAKITNARQTTIILAVDSTLPLGDVVSIFNECQTVCEKVQFTTLPSNGDGAR